MSSRDDDSYENMLAGVLGAEPLMGTSSEILSSEHQDSPVIVPFPSFRSPDVVKPTFCAPEDALQVVSASLMELSHLMDILPPESPCELSDTFMALGLLAQFALPSSYGSES